MSTEESKQAPGGANSPPSTAPPPPSPLALPQRPEQRRSTLGSTLVFGLVSLFVALFLWDTTTVRPDSHFADWSILFAIIGVAAANLITGVVMALLARQFVDRGPRRLAALSAVCLLGTLIPLFWPGNDYLPFAVTYLAACTAAGGALALSAAFWAMVTS